MSRSRFLINVFSNPARFVLAGVVGIIVTPVLVHNLHSQNYGLLIFCVTVVGVLEGIDLGLFSTLLRFTPELSSQNKYSELQALVSTAFFTLMATGTAMAVLLYASRSLIRVIAQVPDDILVNSEVVLVIIGASLIFELPATAIRGYLDGCQEFLKANVVDALTQVMVPVSTGILASNGFSISYVAVAFPIASLARFVGLLWMARLAKIPFRPSLRQVELSSLHRRSEFATLSFVSDNANWWFLQLDTFIAGRSLSFSAVTLLSVARRFPNACIELCYHSFVPTYPMISAAAARKDAETIRRLFVVSSRNVVALVVGLFLPLWVWSGEILNLWVGPDLLNALPVFRVFLLFSVVASLYKVMSLIVQSTGNIRATSSLSVLMVPFGLGVAFWGAKLNGVMGLAVGYASIQAFAVVFLLQKAMHVAEVTLRLWLSRVILPIAACTLPTVLWFEFSYSMFPHNIYAISVSVFAGGILFLGIFIFSVVGFRRDDLRRRVRRAFTEA